MSTLTVNGLSVRTEEERALVSDVSFTLPAGERLGIIGESGSGKSLTALSVLGLLPTGLRATGSIRLGDTELVGASPRTLNGVRGSGIAAVFQEPLTALDPLMRIGKQLAWPLSHHRGLRGDALKRGIIEALAAVALPDPEKIARSYIHEVSGGQRQRVAIALALACNPDILIADEPTTALDISVQAEILELLDTAVRERGMSLLLISHDLAVVSRMTEHLLVLRGGETIEQGATRTLLTTPAADYTRLLVDTARSLEAYLPEVTAPAPRTENHS
ncbi:ABC transporter ATP-binding protein [Mycetocola tolaasinivorans]|uniref:ABC transporter ATP-binding protein n=1 Tax=Mycetocola tolaasinivorans TaxID=76635 RepID=A0A3L7A968_9MICO|nr:ABC transporter ATP-binding protein [Mycetocola tolaasinivorans]RLP76565.1 ABC transporter ATP-binding protein [Mycetocola tolaasinivorans]